MPVIVDSLATPRARGFALPLLMSVLGFWATARVPAQQSQDGDRIKRLQADAVAHKKEKRPRAFHFGSQGPSDVFSNHGSHTNRLIPVYVFGRKADLGAVTDKNSLYRDPAKIEKLYGVLPQNTVNPRAEYCDQSDLYRVQKEAIERGAKHLFIVWFDGLDWPTTQAAAIAKTGKVYTEGKGSGLIFQDETADGSAQYGYCVTSPTCDRNETDVNAQTVRIPADSLRGGYDARIAGPNPWTLGPLGPKAPGYLKGQSADETDKAGVRAVGGVFHAYTDSACSAAEFAEGHKAYNNGVNVTDDGQLITPLFHELQQKGWKVGTATSVPFDHVSPAAMYAHNVDRDDFQDLAREMLGLKSVTQVLGKEGTHPGLDVAMGVGFGQTIDPRIFETQGRNAAGGNPYITDADRAAIDVKSGGRYVVVHTEAGVHGAEALQKAATQAARSGQRLFGFYGSKSLVHLPYRTADGRFDPVAGVRGLAESYSPSDLNENPTLADMTRAALTVLGSRPDQPFALFVEAGDVDFALHDNNLDNAIGAVLSGEAAVKVIMEWVKAHSNWDDSVLIVTADHGHYLVLDDPTALTGAHGPAQKPERRDSTGP
jgi:alkaline phosphatase